MSGPRVAVFRPDDDRIERAVETLEVLGAEPVPDPLLAVEATGTVPAGDADAIVLTSKTGVDLLAAVDWEPGPTPICAIGPATATALETAGYAVDLVPERYTSSGLVEAMADQFALAGSRVEVARSDHGSDVLLEGLREAGATVTETVLYRLTRPAEAGRSVELAAAGALDAALFTSSLTVEHFLAIADDLSVAAEAKAGLESAIVGAIGPPTRDTAHDLGLSVDVVASEATFETLAREVLERLE